MEIENAVIDSVKLSFEDHGILSVWLMLDYGGSGQGFGGYALYVPRHERPFDCAGKFIWRCMEIAGVSDWSQMKGKTIRVKKESYLGAIIAIGHIIKDDWFEPGVELKEV